MTGFGAIVKAVERWMDGAVSAAERDLRSLTGRRPKLCPVPVRDDAKKRRRQDLR